LSSYWKGAPLIALSSVLFAAMAVVVRVIGAGLSTGQVSAVRFAVGLAAVAAVFVARGERPRVPRWIPWATRGGFGAIAVLLYFFSLQSLPVGVATLLNYMAPCYTALFAGLFLDERPTRGTMVGLGVATIGAALVAWSTVDPARPWAFNLGTTAGLLSAVFSGGAVAAIRSLRRDTDASTVFLAFTLFGFVLSLPLAAVDYRPVSAGALGLAVVAGVLSFVAQLMFTYAFGFVAAATGSATMQLTPALSWLMGTVFLGEEPTALGLAGGALCMAGVLWTATRPVAPLRPAVDAGPGGR
jgi:drug/metabolite transporter (DMT)-like permease